MPTDETTLEALAETWEERARRFAASAEDSESSSDIERYRAAPLYRRAAAEARLIADALRFRLVGTGEAELPAVRLAPQYDDATVAAFLEEAILQYSVDDAADSLLLDWAGIAAQRLASLAAPERGTRKGKWTAQLEGARLAEARRELAAEDAAVKEGRAVYNDVVADCDDHSRALDSALASAFEDGAKYARALTAPAAQEGAAASEDTARLDELERVANAAGGIHLHNGSHTGCNGLGLAGTGRTLRQAVDAMRAARASVRRFAEVTASLPRGGES